MTELAVGTLGSIIFLLSYFTQIFHMIKHKTADGPSYKMLFVLALGTICYCYYFFLPFIPTLFYISLAALLSIFIIVFLRLKYSQQTEVAD